MKDVLRNRIVAFLLVVCVCVTTSFAVSTVPAAAKAKPKLSAKSVMIAMGGTKKITLKSGKGSWSIEGNGVARLKSKKKTSVTVVPLRAGDTVVTCKVGKKKLKCKVRVLNNSIGSPMAEEWGALIVGKSQHIDFTPPEDYMLTEAVYDKSKVSVTNIDNESTYNLDLGRVVPSAKIKALKPGKIDVTFVFKNGESTTTDRVSIVAINGFRGKAKAKKTAANYKKWRKQTISTMVSADMTTWQIVHAIGYLISTGKYSLKGGADGKQLWYGGNGTCVSGAKMMHDFMKDLGIKSKIHFAGKMAAGKDIYGFTVFYGSGHKNTWIKLGGKFYELNPQPAMYWPIGIRARSHI